MVLTSRVSRTYPMVAALALLVACSDSSSDVPHVGADVRPSQPIQPTPPRQREHAEVDGGSDGPVADAGPCSTDLLSDANHCGECGHACEGAVCANGMCQPRTLVAVPEGDTFPASTVAADGQNVYFALYSRVSSSARAYVAPKATGRPRELGSFERVFSAELHARGGSLFVYTDLCCAGEPSTFVFDVATGARRETAGGGSDTPNRYVFSDPFVFARFDQGLLFTDVEGTSKRLVRAIPSYDAPDIAATGDAFFYADLEDRTRPRIYRIPKPAGAPATLDAKKDYSGTVIGTTSAGWLLRLVADSSAAYAFVRGEGAVVSLERVDVATGRTTSLATFPKGNMVKDRVPSGVALTDTHVYWTSSLPGGVSNVHRVSKTGGPVETVAPFEPWGGRDDVAIQTGLMVDGPRLLWVAKAGVLALRH